MIRPASRLVARRRRRPPASAAQEDPDLTPQPRSALRSPLSWGQLLVWLLAALALALVLAPVGALIARGITQADIGAALTSPFVRGAVQLSLLTSAVAVVAIVVLGTPTAYLLARRRFPGRALVDAVIDLPIVLPPVVGGLALLLLLGRQGPIGGPLDGAGIDVAFTTTAVVLAQMFVAAPFYIRAARAGFESVDQRLEAVSATLGARPWRTFRRITVPLALPSLAGGAVMAWARALGEFGATIMFAGNVAGRTQTMPLAILEALEADANAAIAIAIVLAAIALAVLIAFRGLARAGSRAL